MKKFSELMEKSGDTAVFTFGRLNPPTTGHGKLIDAMAKEQGKNAGSKMHVFVSHSQDAKKNPLDYKRKVAYIRKMFPKYAKNITTDKAKTIFQVAVSLYNKGYKSIIMVVGSDRVDEFERLLNEYNGVQSKHGYYGFDNVEVVSAGERDPDAEGLEGMSASKMRSAAMDGDLDSFKQGVPDGFEDVEKLYRDVRKSMGIREEKNMGEMDIYEEMRDDYLTGKIWNVGEIVEAKGMSGEIVRKGTNYISFMEENGKVHKAWLHEIELDERITKVTKDVAVKRFQKGNSKTKTYDNFVKTQGDYIQKEMQSILNFANDIPNQKNKRKYFEKGIRGIENELVKRFSKNEEVELVDKGVILKELKAKYQEKSFSFNHFVKEMNGEMGTTKLLQRYKKDTPGEMDEVKQDKDIKDRKGTQPAKYYATDIAPSTKDKRAAHFAKKKAGPAPGDASAKTKPSKHSKKFKQMYGEELPKDADQGDYIDDFEKSDAPQFKGKSKEKRKDMAIAAYLSKNESFLDNINKMLKEDGHTDVASMKNRVEIAMKALEKMQSELGKLGDEASLPTWWTNKVSTAVSRLDDMSDYIDTKVEDFTHYPGQVDPKKDQSDSDWVKGDPPEPIEFDGSDTKSILDKTNKKVEKERKVKVKPFVEMYQLDEKIAGLVKKSKKSGMPYGILKKVYDRGMAAWKTGHRPGTTPQQWAFARVNSFTTKSSGTWGKADADLAKQVRGESIEEDGPCWDTHKQVGMKTKNGKQVPNCVPKNEDLNEWGELEEASEYQGKKVTLNKPFYTPDGPKKSSVYVNNEKGNVVKVNFGDPNMEIKVDDPARRKSFRARHGCDNPGPKWKAKYWSCKAW